MSDPLKVICVGSPSELLESRRLVLQSAGYEAVCVNVSEASECLPMAPFDVMIISGSVPKEDRTALHKAVNPRTRIVQLYGFTSPQELIARLKSEVLAL